MADGSADPRRPIKQLPDYLALQFVSPPMLQDQPVPERAWLVPGWIPMGVVTLFYAAGGEGKTLLSQQLLTSAAIGHRWIGLPVTPCSVMALFCEDDEDEIHRRQVAINQAYGIDFRDLSDMTWTCPVGDDNILVRFDRDGNGIASDRFEDLRTHALRSKPGLIVIDVAADVFGGNENDRQQVTTFIKAFLGALARDTGAAVLLTAHPSRSGVASGAIDGGSTGWTNAARSRLAMISPKAADGDPADLNARIISKPKANYGERGMEIPLRWIDGVFIPDPKVMGGTVAGLERAKVDDIFLDLIAKFEIMKRPVSDSRNSSNFAPRVFELHPDRHGYGKRAFEGAMHRLFASKQICKQHYGKPSDKTHCIARVDPGEGAKEGGEG